MNVQLKYFTVMLGLLLAWSNSDALAANHSNPCPSDAKALGCFEVGLPGSSKFSANQPIAAFTDSKSPIKDLVNLIVTFALGILVIIGVITIVIGGYMYMTAGGNASQVGTAKEWIYSALVGIFIAFISVVLLNSVNKFLGSSAVEPSLAPAGGTGSNSSSNNSGLNTGFNGNEAKLLELDSQKQKLQGDINALNDPFATDAQLAQNNARIKMLQAQMDALNKQIADLNK